MPRITRRMIPEQLEVGTSSTAETEIIIVRLYDNDETFEVVFDLEDADALQKGLAESLAAIAAEPAEEAS